MVCREFLFLKRRKESVSRPLIYPGYSAFISCLSIISQKKMFFLWAPEKMYFLAWVHSASVHSFEVQFSLTVVGWKRKVMKQYVTNRTLMLAVDFPKTSATVLQVDDLKIICRRMNQFHAVKLTTSCSSVTVIVPVMKSTIILKSFHVHWIPTSSDLMI